MLPFQDGILQICEQLMVFCSLQDVFYPNSISWCHVVTLLPHERGYLVLNAISCSTIRGERERPILWERMNNKLILLCVFWLFLIYLKDLWILQLLPEVPSMSCPENQKGLFSSFAWRYGFIVFLMLIWSFRLSLVS